MFKQIIAPVVITLILILVMIVYFVALVAIRSILPSIVIILIGTFIFLGIGVSIINLVERIKEIKKGETDDLSKYWLYF